MHFWQTEADRCVNGYTADDGDFISGYNYFYLNYCPINRSVVKEVNGQYINTREVTFPDFWDYDYYYFNAIQEAQVNGKHLCVLKSRRKGYSYKASAMLCRNYYLIPNSKSYVYASNKQYLTEDGTLTKAWDYMDFIDEHTAWGKKRSVNTTMRKRAGMLVKDEYGNQIEVGYKSEIIGVTLKDNPDIVRGKMANLILFEEAGSFKELSAAWQIARPSVEVDGKAFGTMIAFGCVCAGSRVWTADGNCVNVEDLTIEDGIMGWDTYQAYPQNISHMNPPAKKECLRITTNSGRSIECSKDHPLLWSTPSKTKRVPGKRKENEHMKSWLWHNADLCKVGDQLGIIDEIPFFGKKRMWEPRLIGWLIGDGSYGHDKTPRLSNCDKYILDYVEAHFDTVVEREYPTTTGKQYKELRIKGICPKLRELGIYGQTKNAKRLPINAHSYDRYTLTELLGGLFDTDGCVSIAKDGRVRISITQCQKEILLQIQEILLHFGIHGNILQINNRNRQHYTNGRLIVDRNDYWKLEIGDITSVANFATNINLSVDYKQSALDLIWLFTQNHLAKHHKYLSGIHAERIVKIEDIGLQPIYNLTAKEQSNYIVNGIVTHNTGGDEDSNFYTLKDMFYHPDGYNCLGLQNIWDENVTTAKCGFFIPQYANIDIRDEHGRRLYMDKDGNTITTKARQYILDERKVVMENSTSAAAIDRYVAERPITPTEACLEFNGNIFPKKELQEQLARIRTDVKLQNLKQVGDLTWQGDGTLKWTFKKGGDITHYPLKHGEDPTGSIVIWEHPVKDPPVGLYIMGVDSYDFDESSTTSLGSCFVYKRFQNFESYYDIIVAEYTGRPKTAQEFYENVRKLAVYYNARIMYENQNKGIFSYFTAKHCDYLLADSPDIINDVVKDSKVNRKKGCHMNKEIKRWGEGLVKDWLNEEKSSGHKNLHDIYSEPLLEELISYNDVSNFDRCLLKDSIITTDTGFKRVQDIRVGDKVLTHTGRLKTVTMVMQHIHEGNSVKLRVMGDYRTLHCTDNHPILTAFTDKRTHCFRKDSVNNIQWLRADQLNYRYQFGLLPKRKLTEKIDLSDDVLYLMGWVMSDGYIDNGFGIRITYQINQLECAKKCMNIIEDYLKDELTYHDRRNIRTLTRKPTRIFRYNNCYRLEVHSRRLHELAEWFGCKPNNKKINPEIYNRYSNLMPFIIGWFEGDGHQKLNANYDGYCRNVIEISTIYKDLLLQCRQILIDHGIYSSVRFISPRLGKDALSLNISNEYINKCFNFYPSLKFQRINVTRNTSKVLETDDGFWTPIKLLKITPIKEIVYNFEVEDDHSYIADGIVTHNCMSLIQIMIYREQLHNVVVSETKEENRLRLLFNGPLFTNEWFYDDSSPQVEENVYTF